MPGSIEGTVGASMAIKNASMMQEKDNTLLRKVLDNHSDHVLSLIDSAVTGPQELASSGTVGTRVHVTA